MNAHWEWHLRFYTYNYRTGRCTGHELAVGFLFLLPMFHYTKT